MLVRDMKSSIRLVPGSTQYGDIPYASWQGGMAQLTVSVWVFPTLATQTRAIVDHARSSSWSLNMSSGKARVEFPNGLSDSTDILPLNKWTHLLFTYNGSLIQLYVNSNPEGTPVAKGGTVFQFTGAGIQLGRFNDGAVGTFGGNMCDVAIWNTALTADQISNLSRGTVPTSIAAENLQAYYPLNEGAGTSFYDRSGNTGRDGTWSGSPTYMNLTPTYGRFHVRPNLVSNGDFEYIPPFTAANTTNARWIDGTATGSTTNDIFGWATFGGNSTNSPAQYDTTEKNSGLASLKLSTLATGALVEVHRLYQNTAANYLKYLIPALPNTSYTCTYYMKTNYVSGDSADGARIVILEKDAVNSGSVAANSPTNIKTTTPWTQYSITFTTNSATRYMDIRPTIYGQTGTGTLVMDAWFDDIVLKQTVDI